MKIRTSLAVGACAAFGTYGFIFTSEPAHSAVAVPVGAVFTAVLIACRVISGRRRRSGRAHSREDARRNAATAPQRSGPYQEPPREWAEVCDAEERLEWVRGQRARGAAPAWHVREVQAQLAEARRAWNRTGWSR